MKETNLNLETIPRVEQVFLLVFLVQELHDQVNDCGRSVRVLV